MGEFNMIWACLHVWKDSWDKNDEFGMVLIWSMNKGWL